MSNSSRAYRAIKQLISNINGSMTYEPLVPGGTWAIELYGWRLNVRVADNRVTLLDTLYQQPVPAPIVWEDFPDGEDTPLVNDAFWRVVELIRMHGRLV